MKKCGVYVIKNIVNDKLYVGSSIDIDHRYRVHISNLNNNKHENCHLQYSFNKYGKANFIFYIIEQCKEPILRKREQYYIDTLNTLDRVIGYNIRPDTYCKTFSEETRKKLSIAAKNRPASYWKKLSDTRKGWSPTKEQRKRMSLSHKGKPLSQKHKDSISRALLGRVPSKETIEKQSKARKGRKVPDYIKRKISNALRGRKLSDVTRKKMSDYWKIFLW